MRPLPAIAALVAGIGLTLWLIATPESVDPASELSSLDDPKSSSEITSDPTPAPDIGAAPTGTADQTAAASQAGAGTPPSAKGDGAPEPYVSPAGAAREARLRQPDAVYMGAAASRWRAIERELGYVDSPEARRMIAKIDPIVEAWREARRAPDQADINALHARQTALRRSLVETNLITPAISEILGSLDADERNSQLTFQ